MAASTWTSGTEGVSVVSYNLLGHHHWYWDSSWAATPDSLPWPQRLEAFVHELGTLDADVICCQEVTQEMFASLLPQLAAKGYLGLLALRHLPEWTYNEGWEASQLGLAVFTRHASLEVMETSHRFARDFLSEKEYDVDKSKISACLMKRQDSVLMCKIRRRQLAKMPDDFIIACAHAVWWYDDDPKSPIAAKPVQMMLMVRAVKEFADRCGVDERFVTLCGDFNTMPRKGCSSSSYDDTAGYELFTTGILPKDHREHPAQHGWDLPDLRTPLKLSSAYNVALGTEPSFTTKTSGFTAAIDFIFFGEGFEVESVLPMPGECEPCPNKDHPSDHLPIGATLKQKRA